MARFLRITALILMLLITASVLSSCDWMDNMKLHFSAPTETSTEAPTEAPRGIPEENKSEYVSLSSLGIIYSPNYHSIRPRHSYQMLSKGEQALYNELYDNVREVYPEKGKKDKLYKIKQVIVDKYQLSSADIRVTAKALYDDNPEFFWLSSTIYQLTDTRGNYTAVQLRSIYSPDEIKTMEKKIHKVINAFYAKVPSGLSEYEREKYVHDYVCKLCEYDFDAAAEHSSAGRIKGAYHIYGALINHMAVCEGYARLTELLLNGLGVDCIGITGLGYDSSGDNELHMWNAVNIENDWYYLDVTWDDQLSEYRRYQYFNLDLQTMKQDHQNSPPLSELSEDEINGDETYSSVAMNIYIPECTATAYQYYVYECPHLSDYDGANVKDSLYTAALDQKSFIIVYVDPATLDFDSTMEYLFRESPQYFFSYIEDVNGWLSGYEIDDSNLTYYTNKDRYTVAVELNYY